MNPNLKITYIKPEKQGVFTNDNGYLFATEIESDKECGVILYTESGAETKIPFSAEGRRGTLYGMQIESINGTFPYIKYNYYCGNETYTDSYSKLIEGLNTWGAFTDIPRKTYGLLTESDFDWENDISPNISIQDTFVYGLNVRSFTMHKTSGVKNKGTYEGIIEKISHFQKLGITAIELMPAYEYDEYMKPDKSINGDSINKARVNCWGFQNAFYFAPKASYSKDRADFSFKKMVKELHKNGIEVWMHFYFAPQCNPVFITEVLRFWHLEYHVDGFRLSGFHIPYEYIAGDPILKCCKIRASYFPINEIYDKPPQTRNLISDNGNFKNDMRRYLKGDENLISQVIHYQKNNSDYCGILNYLTDYDGFSLYDLVSYEKKHNEANGEDNRDGAEANYSWNCGIEGDSRKKSVIELRCRQIKNALTFLFLSQGIPYLYSGDEFANTRFGNNNAYCRDDDTGFIKWKWNRFSEEIFDFVCMLSRLRKEYSLLHVKNVLKGLDLLACGYPDISYHGEEAWMPDTSYISRMIGIMLCGECNAEKDTHFLYIAFNMHWESHTLALPKLPKGKEWCLIMSTDDKTRIKISGETSIPINGRSITLIASKNDNLTKKKNA